MTGPVLLVLVSVACLSFAAGVAAGLLVMLELVGLAREVGYRRGRAHALAAVERWAAGRDAG